MLALSDEHPVGVGAVAGSGDPEPAHGNAGGGEEGQMLAGAVPQRDAFQRQVVAEREAQDLRTTKRENRTRFEGGEDKRQRCRRRALTVGRFSHFCSCRRGSRSNTRLVFFSGKQRRSQRESELTLRLKQSHQILPLPSICPSPSTVRLLTLWNDIRLMYSSVQNHSGATMSPSICRRSPDYSTKISPKKTCDRASHLPAQ